MRKNSLTIVIPAYNEEANIAALLSDIGNQHARYYTLDAVIVLSDGSTDGTVRMAKSTKNQKIVVRDYSQRKGKVFRINSAFSAITTDIVVQLDADIRLPNPSVLDAMAKQFSRGKQVDLVCGGHTPLTPETFVERIAYFGEQCWSDAVNSLTSRDTVYRCVGHIRAMSKRFYRQFRLPLLAGTAEDTYSYYFAKTHGYTTVFSEDAVVQYRLPRTIGDYLKQMTRFVGEEHILVQLFPKSLLQEYETMTVRHKWRAFMHQARNTPILLVISYILIQGVVHLLPKQSPPKNGIWEVSQSTKQT